MLFSDWPTKDPKINRYIHMLETTIMVTAFFGPYDAMSVLASAVPAVLYAVLSIKAVSRQDGFVLPHVAVGLLSGAYLGLAAVAVTCPELASSLAPLSVFVAGLVQGLVFRDEIADLFRPADGPLHRK